MGVYKLSSPSDEVKLRWSLFKMDCKHLAKIRSGGPNVRYGWFGCSKDEIQTIFDRGFVHYLRIECRKFVVRRSLHLLNIVLLIRLKNSRSRMARDQACRRNRLLLSIIKSYRGKASEGIGVFK